MRMFRKKKLVAVALNFVHSFELFFNVALEVISEEIKSITFLFVVVCPGTHSLCILISNLFIIIINILRQVSIPVVGYLIKVKLGFRQVLG